MKRRSFSLNVGKLDFTYIRNGLMIFSSKKPKLLNKNIFCSKTSTQFIITPTGPAEGAEPTEAQALSINPCRTAVLTRHSQRGGRIEDACGEVTGHPFDEPYALIRGGLLVVGWSLVQGCRRRSCVWTPFCRNNARLSRATEGL